MPKQKFEKNIIYTVVGTWVQRTRLHLSEIYDFLESVESKLNLDKTTLRSLHKHIGIKKETLSIVISNIDFITFETLDGLSCKIYEDGLITITRNNTDFKEDLQKIKNFYINKLSPAVTYLFSLGAPLPQELTNFEITFPYFIVGKNLESKDITSIFEMFNEHKYYDIKTKSIEIFRGNKVYLINVIECNLELINRFIEEQIFMREYSNLLHNYLNLHRHLWEEIESLRSVPYIKGNDVLKYKSILAKYDKSALLIDQRIHQMPIYLSTRENLSNTNSEFNEKFGNLLSYKYQTLRGNHDYIIGIWGITKSYINQAQENLNEINNIITTSSLGNLTIITATGAAGTVIGLFTQKLPSLQIQSLYYFFILFCVGYMVQRILKLMAKHRSYRLSNEKLRAIDFSKLKDI